MIRNVAALYVDPRGPYPKLVEHWYDEKRDARKYAGPWPVVAHPPCGPWSSLRHLHTKPEEKELGALAMSQARTWGGIVEQPAGSRLFGVCGLEPTSVMGLELRDRFGFVVVVDQVYWGHVARKRTWLYCVGIPSWMLHVVPPRPNARPTHWCSGGRTKRPGMGATVPPGIKVCSAQQRRRTPVAFAEWLLSLASTASSHRPEQPHESP